MTKGRGGTNTFTEVSEVHRINMLQSMYSASLIDSGNQQVPYGAITGTAQTSNVSYSNGSVISVNDSSVYSVGMGIAGDNIPLGAVITSIDGSAHTLTISPTPTGSGTSILRLPIGSEIPINYNSNQVNEDVRDANITESKFLNHFSRNFSSMGSDAYFVLPPAFRTFYSDRTEFGAVTSNQFDTHRTINAMASKEDLVIDDDPSGVAVNNRTTEYAHASNVLEYMQQGGDPYHGCDICLLYTSPSPRDRG